MARKNNKFAALSHDIVGLMGGKDNITWFSHCVTRLRFTVKDRGLVEKGKIEAISGVMGSQWSGEQYQVIIGPDVADAYAAICAENAMEAADAVEENLDGDMAHSKKRFSLNAVIDGISGCITPLIPLLMGSGMIKVVLALAAQFGLPVTDPTYVTLNFVSDAAFYFLPIAVGVTGAKKFGANVGMGIILGGMLVHPTFVQMVADGAPGSVYGIPITGFKYASTVIPMIITMFVCGYVERFMAKISPAPIRGMLEPMLTLLVMAPITLCVIGPLGGFLGNYMADFIMWVYNTIGFLAIGILCCLHPLLVMTGMHTALIPFVTQSFATMGFDPIFGAQQLVSNMNEGIASLVVSLKSKFDPELRSNGMGAAITALVGGVTEPALYGVNLKLKTPLMAVMIGNLCGGLYCGLMGILRYSYGGSNLLGLAVFIGDKPNNLLNMCIAVVIGAVVTFISAWLLYKPEQKVADSVADASTVVE